MTKPLLPDLIGDAHPDLRSAINNNGCSLSSPIFEVLAHIDGANEGPNWHWIVLLENGRLGYLTGGCDYTGWDCHSSLDVLEETIEAVLRQVGETESDDLRRLIEQKTGTTVVD